MPPHQSLARLALCLLALGAGACSGDPNGPQAVSGTVTFRGRPLDAGRIEFLTPAGPAGGAVIQAGSYELPREHGLTPGTYRVSVRSPEPVAGGAGMMGGATATRERVPAEFNEKSTRTVEVRPGTVNRFDFTID